MGIHFGKKFLLALAILFSPIAFLCAGEEDLLVSKPSQVSPSIYLDPSQRSKEVKDLIASTFDKISKSKPIWNFNGVTHYNLMGIDDHKLVKNIIHRNIDKQKEFYFLDIGAGNCAWATGVVNFLNQQPDLFNDITIHIISLTGEHYDTIPVPESNFCKVYNLCSFEIENLSDSLQKRGLDFNNKIDLIVSNYCFMHLHDPSGTFVQAYNLLRPYTGIMVLDGFPLHYDDDPDLTKDFASATKEFLQSTQVPFLMSTYVARDDISHHGIYPFMIQRPDQTPCQLSYMYAGLEKRTVNRDWVAGGVTILKKVASANFNKDNFKREGYNLGYPAMLEFEKSLFKN